MLHYGLDAEAVKVNVGLDAELIHLNSVNFGQEITAQSQEITQTKTVNCCSYTVFFYWLTKKDKKY